MYGFCPICGMRFGSNGIEEYPLCEHMHKKQMEFMAKKTKRYDLFPGGKGSRLKSQPLIMKRLKGNKDE